MNDTDETDSCGPCPKCNGPTGVDPDCPGWRNRRGVVMVCQGCGNAERYFCTSENCDWWYRDPVGIRSGVAEMGVRPSWIKGEE